MLTHFGRRSSILRFAYLGDMLVSLCRDKNMCLSMFWGHMCLFLYSIDGYEV